MVSVLQFASGLTYMYQNDLLLKRTSRVFCRQLCEKWTQWFNLGVGFSFYLRYKLLRPPSVSFLEITFETAWLLTFYKRLCYINAQAEL